MKARHLNRRVATTLAREPVEWVVLSIFMLGFGTLLLLAGVVDSVDGLRTETTAIRGTAVVSSCNDLRVQRCKVTIQSPPSQRRSVTIEPGRNLEAGEHVPILLQANGQVSLAGSSEWSWRIGAIIAGLFVAILGGWRLLTGRA